jgi:hypothetical protein
MPRIYRRSRGINGAPAFDQAAAIGGGSSFLPSDVSGLAAWWPYGVGITAAGGFVSQWDDRSGFGRHLKQATATNQPALESDNSLTFDGVDNFLKTDAFTLNQPETVYLLFNAKTWTTGDSIYDGNAAAGGRLFQAGTTPELRITAGITLPGLTSFALDTYGVVAVVFNSTNSLMQHNLNAPIVGDAGTNNIGGFTLGARGDGLAQWAHMQVKEGAVYAGAHDAQTREQVIRYLATVGGISV